MGSDEIPEDVAAQVLAQCGRCCCICRRFKPIRLQVHHIKQRSQGGTNDPDNLIALCINCHIDVHSKLPFVRRFSEQEQKLSRNNVYQLIRDGKLVPDEEPNVRTVTSQPILADGLPVLIPETLNLLISMAQGDGCIYDSSGHEAYGSSFTREEARQREAFEQLRNNGFIRHSGGDLYVLTSKGYLAADGYLALINEKSKGAIAHE